MKKYWIGFTSLKRNSFANAIVDWIVAAIPMTQVLRNPVIIGLPFRLFQVLINDKKLSSFPDNSATFVAVMGAF